MGSRSIINILDLRDSPWVDGPGRTVLETAAHIDRGRFRFIVGSFTGDYETANVYLDTARERGLETLAITERAAFDPGIARRIRQLIRDRDIHILHTHEFRSNLYGWLAARGTGVTLTSTCHGWITNTRKRKWFKELDKLLLKRFDHVTTVSTRIRSELVSAGMAPDKVTYLQNALVLDRYARRGSGQAKRSEFGLDPEDIVVAKIGRLSPEKNQLSLLRALANLRRRHPAIRLLLVGKGPDEAALRAEAEQLRLGDSVIFAGYQDDMIPIYEMADLVVQSSFTEGMPNVVLEALAMEVPVIATDVGGTGQIITGNETGVLLANADPAALETAMEDFILHRDRYRDMARRGRQVIVERFDFRQRTRLLMDSYAALVNGRRVALAGGA